MVLTALQDIFKTRCELFQGIAVDEDVIHQFEIAISPFKGCVVILQNLSPEQLSPMGAQLYSNVLRSQINVVMCFDSSAMATW